MGEMFQDPAFFFSEEVVDSGFWYCTRCADSYLAGSADLNCQGLAAAADKAVGERMLIHGKSSLYLGVNGWLVKNVCICI